METMNSRWGLPENFTPSTQTIRGISFALSFSCVFSQWKELLEMLGGFVSKELPKICVTILGKKNLSLDSFSLRRLCLFSVLVSGIRMYAFLNSPKKEKEVVLFKPHRRNYAFSNIMQFWPHVTYLLKILLICLRLFFWCFFVCLFRVFLECLALFKAHCPFWHWNYIILNMCDTTLISIAGD